MATRQRASAEASTKFGLSFDDKSISCNKCRPVIDLLDTLRLNTALTPYLSTGYRILYKKQDGIDA